MSVQPEMMKEPCPQGDERLTAYLDGELAEGERAELERHLQGCERCLCELEELRLAASAIRALLLGDGEPRATEDEHGALKQRVLAGGVLAGEVLAGDGLAGEQRGTAGRSEREGPFSPVMILAPLLAVAAGLMVIVLVNAGDPGPAAGSGTADTAAAEAGMSSAPSAAPASADAKGKLSKKASELAAGSQSAGHAEAVPVRELEEGGEANDDAAVQLAEVHMKSSGRGGGGEELQEQVARARQALVQLESGDSDEEDPQADGVVDKYRNGAVDRAGGLGGKGVPEEARGASEKRPPAVEKLEDARKEATDGPQEESKDARPDFGRARSARPRSPQPDPSAPAAGGTRGLPESRAVRRKADLSTRGRLRGPGAEPADPAAANLFSAYYRSEADLQDLTTELLHLADGAVFEMEAAPPPEIALANSSAYNLRVVEGDLDGAAAPADDELAKAGDEAEQFAQEPAGAGVYTYAMRLPRDSVEPLRQILAKRSGIAAQVGWTRNSRATGELAREDRGFFGATNEGQKLAEPAGGAASAGLVAESPAGSGPAPRRRAGRAGEEGEELAVRTPVLLLGGEVRGGADLGEPREIEMLDIVAAEEPEESAGGAMARRDGQLADDADAEEPAESKRSGDELRSQLQPGATLYQWGYLTVLGGDPEPLSPGEDASVASDEGRPADGADLWQDSRSALERLREGTAEERGVIVFLRLLPAPAERR